MIETTDAIDWAQQFYAHDTVEEITHRPWGVTLRLSHEDSCAYLKIIPLGRPHSVEIAQCLFTQCPAHVPGIIAADANRGLLLLNDHGGQDLGRQVSDTQRHAIIREYARIQGQAKSNAELMSVLPEVDLACLVPDFLDFLKPEPQQYEDGGVRASYFLGRSSAKRYYAIFTAMKEQLSDFIMLANSLPDTLSHGDLRSQNIAIGNDGNFIFYDWDDAGKGPPGLSLHTQFSGCCRPLLAIGKSAKDNNQSQVTKDREVLDIYIDAATKAGLAKRDDLQERLPSAITAGVLRYLMSYSTYPGESSSYRKTIRKILKRRLSDLMDLCQLLVADNIEANNYLAKVFAENGRRSRAKLLDPASYAQSDGTTQQTSRFENPDLQAMLDASNVPDIFPSIDLTCDEIAAGKPSNETIELGAALFNHHGTLLIKNALPVSLLEHCRNHFIESYEKYFTEKKHSDALRVGDKRYMITLRIEPPFDDPALYASPLVMPVLEIILGKKMLLGSYTSVTSLPRADEQRVHKDHPAIFPETGKPTPSFAVTLIIPLINLDKITGATHVIKGSHRHSSKTAKQMPIQEPVVPLGSCFLMDYRLSHQGAGNRSDQIRPILSLVYQRPWFRDFVNYKKQKPLDISTTAREKIPKVYSHLFDWS